MSYPDWWPDGVEEHYVRACNCEYCADLAAQLDEYREQQSEDGEHIQLDAF